LAEQHAGWDLTLADVQKFVSTLTGVVGMDQVAYTRWTEGARRLAGSVISNTATIKDNVTLFERSLIRDRSE
jgi:hypothetical protein